MSPSGSDSICLLSNVGHNEGGLCYSRMHECFTLSDVGVSSESRAGEVGGRILCQCLWG